jgi:hypothetical protein
MNGNMINSPSNSSSNKALKWLVIVLVVALVFGILAYLFGDKIKNKASVTSDYQAVFLTNGQVYFGSLELGHGWVVLRDIYYLQVTQDLQPASGNEGGSTTPNQSNNQTNQNQQIQLVKLGSELHGPEDEMFIDKDKILFWENMKDESQVLKKIQEHKNR